MSELTDLKRRLQMFLLDQQPAKIAEVYRTIIAQEPGFCLVPGAQFDLGRYLERGGFPALALRAYDTLAVQHPDAPISAQAMLLGARLCAILPNEDERGRGLIEAFLRTNPPEPERDEAIKLLSAFRGERLLVTPLDEGWKRGHRGAGAQDRRHAPSPSANPPAADRQGRSQSDAYSIPADAHRAGRAGDEESHLLDLNEVQKFLSPAPAEGSGPSIENLASVMPGHDLIFEEEPEPDQAGAPKKPLDPPSRQFHFNDVVVELNDAPDADATPEAPVSDAEAPSQPSGRPHSASQFLRRAGELQQQYDAQRRQDELSRRAQRSAAADKKFAIILPLHKPIHPKRIAKLLAPLLERSPQQILEIMKNGKGLLFENLSLSHFQDLVGITRPVSPDLLYIQIGSKLVFREPIDVLRLELSANGGRAVGQSQEAPFLWGEVLLISCGRVYLDELRRAGKNVLDIFLSRDRLHLRVWDATFQYKVSGFDYDPLGDRNFAGLLSRIAKAAPPATHFSPTAQRMLQSGDSIPQRFESVNSYDRYCRWLLYHFFGKRVKI